MNINMCKLICPTIMCANCSDCKFILIKLVMALVKMIGQHNCMSGNYTDIYLFTD